MLESAGVDRDYKPNIKNQTLKTIEEIKNLDKEWYQANIREIEHDLPWAKRYFKFIERLRQKDLLLKRIYNKDEALAIIELESPQALRRKIPNELTGGTRQSPKYERQVLADLIIDDLVVPPPPPKKKREVDVYELRGYEGQPHIIFDDTHILHVNVLNAEWEFNPEFESFLQTDLARDLTLTERTTVEEGHPWFRKS